MTGRNGERADEVRLTAHALHRVTGRGAELEQRRPRSSSPDAESLLPANTRTGSRALASVTRRLYDDYREQVTLVDVVLTVCRSRRELDIVVDASLPEMLERLARQRLTDRCATSREEPSA